MDRSILNLAFCASLCILFLTSSCQRKGKPSEPRRPNVLLILTDDQGWGDLGVHGNSNIRTPNLDELSRSGVTLTQFFVQPVCSPTRAEILTGKYYPRLGVYSTSAGGERMDPEVPTLGTLFKSAGYRTGLFGKWHNGSQAPYHPNFRGFDEFYGFASGHWAHYFNPELERNGTLTRGQGYLPDDLTNNTLDFMRDKDDTPFFAMLCYNTPHSPMQVPDSYWQELQDRKLSLRHREPEREDTLFTKAALAMVENIDRNVGRLMSYLKSSGADRNTIVIFLSDNGPNSYRWNGGLKGRKGSTDEGGVKSPFIVHWPEVLPAGKSLSTLSGSIDLLPTLAGLAQIPLEFDTDGRDLSASLQGNPKSQNPRLLYHRWNGKTSVRSQDFRLDSDGKLFDMRDDPSQLNDVSDSLPALRDSLLRAKTEWEGISRSGEPHTPKAFTVGYPGAELTYLPARDGQSVGPVKRSNRYPNASYFGNWNTESGKVIWPVEIMSEGRYEATLYYACPEEARGLEIRLKSRADMITSRLEKAYISEVYGQEEDRIPRIESYAKDFYPQLLGSLHLMPGVDTLELEAGPFPEHSELEVQRLALRKLQD